MSPESKGWPRSKPGSQLGRITSWNDVRGFGYITPADGGAPVFVHISSFSGRRRRPNCEAVVRFEHARDERGRPCAIHVEIVSSKPSRPVGREDPWGAATFIALFSMLLVSAMWFGGLPAIAVGIYFGASVVAFWVYAIDKNAAEQGSWRTRENALHLLSLAGGWPGALLAQRILRHKIRKSGFQFLFWITVVLNVTALLVWANPTTRSLAVTLMGGR